MSRDEIEKMRSDMHTGVKMMLEEMRKLGEKGFPLLEKKNNGLGIGFRPSGFVRGCG